jgi:UDP-3-O-[3-hydroxymyristoyl] glucosamine N-acyltransferase
VVLGDSVEVQANACIDRASVGETRIGSGTKVDNLVQVGHGSIVGQDTLLCAQVGLAGSSTVGNNVILAGQVGVVGHSTIGDGVVVTAQSGVPGDVAPGTMISGSPAFDHREWMRSVAAFRRLPGLIRKLSATSK